MLSVQNLSKCYDKNKINQYYALKDITLNFPKTGLVSILGPSGCGKTTLLNILAGIDSPTSGNVSYDNIKVDDDFRYQNVGVIFQDFGLLENKTVEENIRIGYLEASEQALNDTLKALDILNLKDRRVSMLSGGEKQRVSIARAIIKKPAYILADEPTGNLDLKNRMRIMQILKSLSTHMLVILVSHDVELVTKYSDRMIKLADGMVVEDDEVYKKELENNFAIKQKTSNFNLLTYIEETFKLKRKTSFITILYTLVLTTLLCFISANVTGYKYKSSPIPNNYITIESLYPEVFEDIKDKGNFQYTTYISDFQIPTEKEFIKAYKELRLKNRDILLYPYQNEKIITSIQIEKSENIPVYLSSKLANRLLKEGQLEDFSVSGNVPLKKVYIQKKEDLLGSKVIADKTYDIVGIVDSKVEGILYTDSYYAFHNSSFDFGVLPYSIYKKYNPQAPQIETGHAICLGENLIDSNLRAFGFKKNILVKENIPEILYLNDKGVKFIVSDYDYYQEYKPKLFYTTQLKKVTSSLIEAGIFFEINTTSYYKYVDLRIKDVFTLVYLGIASILLIFSLFFILVDSSNYINQQIQDIVILRNLGISKTKIINTYSIKLYLKLLPSFVLGFIIGILGTYHLKSFDHTIYFFFEVNPITLLLCFIIEAAILCSIIYLYLFKRFRVSAASLKVKNKV